ncbi:MAG: hypothetical protein HC780_19610 [Leptolyngbyaceae cyanobacterium CSU_1_3]|nr:hypothetical protein [Leptolyngbyaceae cyanobacterium CSU_1_3]
MCQETHNSKTLKRTTGDFTMELIAGYWLWQVSSMEDAIAWVKRCPNPMLTTRHFESITQIDRG